MANNRVYMRCRGCGETLFLGKSFLGGFYYPDRMKADLADRLNYFYKDHNYCNKPKYSGPCFYDEKAFPMPEDCDGTDGSFDLVYEDALYAGYPEPEEEEEKDA